MDQIKILGIKIDLVNLTQAEEIVIDWLNNSTKTKHIIITPNVEFIMAAQKDSEFKKILNQSDLAIPDSARLGWANLMHSQKNLIARTLLWPFFLAPKLVASDFPVTAGVDLMEGLCKLAAEKGWKVGLIGGGKGVAEKTKNKLVKKYPNLKVSYCDEGGQVNTNGLSTPTIIPKAAGSFGGPSAYQLPTTDLLFVAFGQIKQEKWIDNYKDQINAKVFMGVGGSFDYLSGVVPRAPKQWQKLGLEWLFRLIKQPWRIKRFGALLRFVFKLLFE